MYAACALGSVPASGPAGTASDLNGRPTPGLRVWSGNRESHRLSRTGDRQVSAAVQRVAITGRTIALTSKPSWNVAAQPAISVCGGDRTGSSQAAGDLSG
jgi:hypothetical protein